METRFLLPGEYFISKQPTMFETLLGSCVCVCIYNIENGIAAMNHFLQSEPGKQDDFDIGYYGSSSTRHIIEKLFAIDPSAKHYEAEVFGGGAVLKNMNSTSNIGKENIDIAHKILTEYRIRMVHEEVGGTQGRRVRFDTGAKKIFCRFAGEVDKKFDENL